MWGRFSFFLELNCLWIFLPSCRELTSFQKSRRTEPLDLSKNWFLAHFHFKRVWISRVLRYFLFFIQNNTCAHSNSHIQILNKSVMLYVIQIKVELNNKWILWPQEGLGFNFPFYKAMSVFSSYKNNYALEGWELD